MDYVIGDKKAEKGENTRYCNRNPGGNYRAKRANRYGGYGLDMYYVPNVPKLFSCV